MRNEIVFILLLFGAVMFSGCVSNNASVKQTTFEYQIEGYNVSFSFDATGYKVLKEETQYGKETMFSGAYYQNGINITNEDGSKGLTASIRKYAKSQDADINTSEAFLRLGLGLGAVQGVEFNRSVVDGHETLIFFVPSQEIMGKKRPNVGEAQYYLDNKTLVSVTSYGLSKTDLETILDSFKAKKADRILDQNDSNAISGSDMYTIKIKSTGEWRGSILAGGKVESAHGLGDKTINVQGSPLSATFTKMDESSLLTVEVWNGDMLKESKNSTAPNGVVAISA